MNNYLLEEIMHGAGVDQDNIQEDGQCGSLADIPVTLSVSTLKQNNMSLLFAQGIVPFFFAQI